MRPLLLRREPPLAPDAVAACSAAVPGLAAATALRIEGGAELRACTGNGWLLVLGASPDLPWANDVAYLAWQEGLLLPTTVHVAPSADLLRRALSARAPRGHDLVALVGEQVLSSPRPQRAADPARLLALTHP